MGICHPSPENGNRSHFQNVVVSGVQNSGRWTESRHPVILSIVHHRQNPSGCAYLVLEVELNSQNYKLQ
jgi:hypothetical protein